MKKMLLIALCIFTTLTPASSQLDKELSQYIRRFQFKALSPQKDFGQDLFKLGQKLFFEKEISGNRDISCSSCHELTKGTSDKLVVSLGTGATDVNGKRVATSSSQIIARNSPSLYNIGHKDLEHMFWDGRVRYNRKYLEFSTPEPGLNGEYPQLHELTQVLDSALAAQALFPIADHKEMRGSPKENELADARSNVELWQLVMKRLLKLKEYETLFKRAFPNTNEPNIAHFANALAHYQRHAFSVTQTPWDNYLRGNLSALNDQEKKGAIIFSSKARCATCHNGSLLGGRTFHNVTTPQIGPGKDIQKNDEGHFYVSGKDHHRYSFKTPMLRNVAFSAPYFHAGSYQSIDEVIEHYALGTMALDSYDPVHLKKYEEENYKKRLFVQTDNYMLFRKKETAHPVMRGHAIKLNNEEKKLLKLFLTKTLSADFDRDPLR